MISFDAHQRSWPVFGSFFMGGFEGATHRRRDGLQIDVMSRNSHDGLTALDYDLLATGGVKTVRDSLRWHSIETSPGRYDWSGFEEMLEAAEITGTQVIWDLCHWGYPQDLDPFSGEFLQRFAQFAAAADLVVQRVKKRFGNSAPTIYCPINEISFWAWVGGDEEHFAPHAAERGPELKLQLARATILATKAIRAQNPTARFVQAEPIIHISTDEPESIEAAARHTASQYEAWDLLAGVREPELGGGSNVLDMIGVNYYWNNQWIHKGDRTPPGHEHHRALNQMLLEIWERYQRPILITETGAECGAEFGWLGYIGAEVRQAHRLGVPVLGICIYPVMDYPGWDDDRHCECGLIAIADDWTTRSLRTDYCDEVQYQQQVLQLSVDRLRALGSKSGEVADESLTAFQAYSASQL